MKLVVFEMCRGHVFYELYKNALCERKISDPKPTRSEGLGFLMWNGLHNKIVGEKKNAGRPKPIPAESQPRAGLREGYGSATAQPREGYGSATAQLRGSAKKTVRSKTHKRPG